MPTRGFLPGPMPDSKVSVGVLAFGRLGDAFNGVSVFGNPVVLHPEEIIEALFSTDGTFAGHQHEVPLTQDFAYTVLANGLASFAIASIAAPRLAGKPNPQSGWCAACSCRHQSSPRAGPCAHKSAHRRQTSSPVSCWRRVFVRTPKWTQQQVKRYRLRRTEGLFTKHLVACLPPSKSLTAG
ncbi:MAG: hypothetical protein JWP47_173 [Polaromonas sp.]|nr:hypothetical protein [Polaromonas sp.]